MTPTPESVAALLAERPGAVWLDGESGGSRWSILSFSPDDVITDAAGWVSSGRSLVRPESRGGAPFAGGVIGYLGYGAGAHVEAVPPDGPTPEPPVWLARYPGGLCFDHDAGAWIVEGEPDFVRAGCALIARAERLPPAPPAPPATARSASRREHEHRIRRILEWIADGDCYQVNLARAVEMDGSDNAFAAYRRLRVGSPAPYGAFLRISEDLAVLSNSPERLLDRRGAHVVSSPIKGTRPRGADPASDRALADALAGSEKDRAELVMIVDLVRNDLGKVATPGSVVAHARRLVRTATVHHAVADVTATLRDGLDAWDTLAALLPYGSVTGAPKIRACERIRELEDASRGVYTGAIGYVADGGDASFSVAIRTAVHGRGWARFHVGGGIVADSDPAEEWAETEVKAAALTRALVGARALAEVG
jgi:para-aminobenzoate synthetase component 1